MKTKMTLAELRNMIRMSNTITFAKRMDGPNLVGVLNAAGFYQKKEWVGLTDEEFKKVCWESGGDGMTGDREESVRTTERLLRTKNND